MEGSWGGEEVRLREWFGCHHGRARRTDGLDTSADYATIVSCVLASRQSGQTLADAVAGSGAPSASSTAD